MRIKKIYARNMTEALKKVKAELGEDAVILKTERAPGGSRFSSGGIEVTAAVDWEGGMTEGNAATFVPPVRPAAEAKDANRAAIDEYVGSSAPQASIAGAQEVSELRQELHRMQSMLSHLTEVVRHQETRHVPRELRKSYEQLIAHGVNAEVAERVVGLAADSLSPEQLLQPIEVRREVERQVALSFCNACRTSEGSRPKVFAVVGPTGVGKTTTIAKLAARARVIDGLSVGLISTDTYRIAAVEQLRTFAAIADIPLEVVYTAEEMKRALRKFAYADQVYIDTTGRSPHDAERIHQLQELVYAATPTETHLALSLTTRDEDQLEVLEKYRALRYNRLLFTKLDETSCPGSLLNIAFHAELPVSFVTHGQSVPDDVLKAGREVLSRLVLGNVTVSDLATRVAA